MCWQSEYLRALRGTGCLPDFGSITNSLGLQIPGSFWALRTGSWMRPDYVIYSYPNEIVALPVCKFFRLNLNKCHQIQSQCN